ncbi:MAG: hypothetical protein R3C61_16040 [Bacteroidia bacterium]
MLIKKDKVFNALKNGANGYILKGEKPKAILEAVKQAKEGHCPRRRKLLLLPWRFPTPGINSFKGRLRFDQARTGDIGVSV